MPQIDYFFSTLSPFTYLAGARLEEIAAKHGADIAYKPVDIAQLFARTGGVMVGERHPSRQAYRLQELRRGSEKADLPINLKPMFFPTNPAPSCYAVIAAQNAGGGDVGGLVQTFLRNCWADEKDIAQDDVIRAALEKNGFDPSLADSGLLSGAQTYEANLDEAIARGAFGSPFYIVGEECFWGHDRLNDLDTYLGKMAS